MWVMVLEATNVPVNGLLGEPTRTYCPIRTHVVQTHFLSHGLLENVFHLHMPCRVAGLLFAIEWLVDRFAPLPAFAYVCLLCLLCLLLVPAVCTYTLSEDTTTRAFHPLQARNRGQRDERRCVHGCAGTVYVVCAPFSLLHAPPCHECLCHCALTFTARVLSAPRSQTSRLSNRYELCIARLLACFVWHELLMLRMDRV